ncbi:MAG: hypothetical protein NTV43_12085 [Methylococcales bacterium]|nr:hypothetical protein [Methylococcales bacterium]
MFKVAFDLVRLRTHPFADYNWPFWQSALMLTFIGVLAGLEPSSEALTLPSLSIFGGVFIVWASYPIMMVFLRWWLKRGGRWDGQGNLFNLIVAASAIDMLAVVLTIAGAEQLLFVAPVWIYSVWIAAAALKGACHTTMPYTVAGVLLAMVPAIIVVGIAWIGIIIIFAETGLVVLQ